MMFVTSIWLIIYKKDLFMAYTSIALGYYAAADSVTEKAIHFNVHLEMKWNNRQLSDWKNQSMFVWSLKRVIEQTV